MAWLTQHPFIIGLATGLLVALVVWLRGIFKSLTLSRDNKTLKSHLHTQMEITAKGNQNTQSELETLRKQNENLRITVATLKNKPGKAELRTLQLYDRAIRTMHEKAPGFAPAWENVLKEAEEEMQKTDTGVLPFIRKVLGPSVSRESVSQLPAVPAAEADQSSPIAVDADSQIEPDHDKTP